MSEALEQMRRLKDVERRSPLAADRLFHLRVAEATGNGALVAVVKMLWEERMGPLFTRLEHHYDTPKAVGQRARRAPHRLRTRSAGAMPTGRARRCSGISITAYKRFSRSWDTQH